MAGVKISRAENENRFKKGMYPTETDFANVFASFVHKDDTVKMSQVSFGEGGGNLGEVIDGKADKQTVETFVKEVETALGTVRDEETGEITKTVIDDLRRRIEAAENDLAARPTGSFLRQVADLDAYTDAQDGEIVQYVGQTDGRYTRGWFYERAEDLDTGDRIWQNITTSPAIV